jgi:hypothetical protein
MDSFLMGDPMSATRSSDRLPVVVGDVPDKALFRLHVPVDATARRSYSSLALRAVVLAKDGRG